MKINKKYSLLVVSLLLLFLAIFRMDGLTDFSRNMALFDVKTLLLVACLFLVTVILSFVRIWVIFRDFGHAVAFLDVAKACMAGNIGALFFIPVFGQIAGRQVYLEKLGISAIENSAASGYERVVAGAVSAFFALLGFIYIYDIDKLEGASFSNLILFSVSAFIALVVFFKWITGEQENQAILSLLTARSLYRFVRVVCIVAAGMVIMMLCFTLMFAAILPGTEYLQLVAIAFIVSFLASLPVSFGGWGLREVATMFFASHLGGSAEAGFVASLFIGLISMAVVLLFYPILILGKGK